MLKYHTGRLNLRKESGGYRHYITNEKGNAEEIRCGNFIEVKLGDQWIQGRYECSLTERDTAARLYDEEGEHIVIPLGSTVRKVSK